MYAGLFQNSASWALDVVATESELVWDDPDGQWVVRKSTTGRGVCRIARTAAFETSIASKIDCEFGVKLRRTHDPVQGVWVADARGLYWHEGDEWPAQGEPEHIDSLRVLPTPPIELHHRALLDVGFVLHDIVKKGDAWCLSNSDTSGSRRWQSICIDPDGVTEGGWGTEEQRVAFEYRFTRRAPDRASTR